MRGVGVDIVCIPKFKRALGRWGARMLGRLFTEGERSYCLRRRRPEEHLAARFAAKVSVMKAYGSPAGFLDIEVKKTGPRPFATLKGMSASITLSHDGKFAIATAVLGKGGRKLHRSI